LLTVHLNSIRHHHTKTAHTRGPNPLAFMGIYKEQASGCDDVRYFLYEERQVQMALAAGAGDGSNTRITNRPSIYPDG
jgi:hypothetical protein